MCIDCLKRMLDPELLAEVADSAKRLRICLDDLLGIYLSRGREAWIESHPDL